jgi:hypothetical protein
MPQTIDDNSQEFRDVFYFREKFSNLTYLDRPIIPKTTIEDLTSLSLVLLYLDESDYAAYRQTCRY